MANAFSGSRQAMYSPYSQIGTDPFGYSAGGTFMGGGMGGYGGSFGMPSYGMPSYGGGFGMGGGYGGMPSFINPFSGGGFGMGSGIGGYGGGYPTSFGGMNMGGGSMGYQFPVPPQPSINDLFGQYMMNQYYGGGAFNPFELPPLPRERRGRMRPQPIVRPLPEGPPGERLDDGGATQPPRARLDLMGPPTITQQQLRQLTESLGNLNF